MQAFTRRTLLLALAAWSAKGSAAAPPQVNLLVELRVVDEDGARGSGDYTVSTRASRAAEPLQLLLMNGQSGTLRLGRAMPVQWVRAAVRGAAPASGGAPAGGVEQALAWFDAGQGLWVLARWPGGQQPVQLDLRFDAAQLEDQAPSPLPARRAQLAQTSVLLPLDIWTTFAATGAAADAPHATTLGTRRLSGGGRQWMQVRVSRP